MAWAAPSYDFGSLTFRVALAATFLVDFGSLIFRVALVLAVAAGATISFSAEISRLGALKFEQRVHWPLNHSHLSSRQRDLSQVHSENLLKKKYLSHPFRSSLP